MHRLMLGCFLLALVNFSAAAAQFRVQQRPRFYGVKTGMQVRIICSTSDPNQNTQERKWFKAKEHDDNKSLYDFNTNENIGNTTLLIKKAELDDSGIYYCKVGETFGHGTEVKVLRHSSSKHAAHRSNMKDFIIFLQSFLLVLCIVLPAVWHYKLGRKEEAVYEEPERDNTYEGLEIEHCGDLYEDIRPFCQGTQGPEAAWEVAEDPELESPEVECPEQE